MLKKVLHEKRGAEQFELEKIKGVTDEVLKVNGIAPRKEVEGVTRVICSVCSGLGLRTREA